MRVREPKLPDLMPVVSSLAHSLVVNYISAPPGTGKSSAGNEYMRQHIQAGIDGKAVGYVFYVAPTTLLLDQGIRNLKAVVPLTQHHMIRAEYSVASERRHALDMESRILAVLDDQKTNTRNVIPFTDGSVLFMTHESFVKLRRHSKFARTTVIFDEARKWAMVNTEIELPDDSALNLFYELFSEEPVKGHNGKQVNGIHAIRPKAVPHNKMAALIENKSAGNAFKDLHTLYKSLDARNDSTVRMQVFGNIDSKGAKKKLVALVLPSHPFKGFRKVMILSADFRTSQMYHLLKWEGCRMIDDTVSFMSRYTKGGYERALKTIQKRYLKLTVVPLMEIDWMPSKHHIDGGIILPADMLVKFQHKKEQLNLSSAALRDLVQHIRYPDRSKGRLTDQQSEMQHFIEGSGCRVDMLDWMLRACERIAKAWLKKYPCDETGVMIVNKDYGRRAVDPVLFDHMEVGRVEGRNDKQGANMVAFLAAINPDEMLRNLLSVLLPDYDADEDYIVDKAVQSVGRGNIRDHRSKQKMLAIVPTSKLAEALCKRMGDAPQIAYSVTEKLGFYTPYTKNKAAAAYAAEVGDDEPDRKKRFAAKVGSAYRQIVNARSRTRKKLETDPDNVKLQEKVADLDAQWERMKADR